MYRVWGDRRSGNCHKVGMIFRQLGLDHEWIETSVMDGSTRAPEFLAMNPVGQVPVLAIAPGDYLAESNAILVYLSEGTALWPATRRGRAEALRWMFFEQYKHEPNIAVARFIHAYLNDAAAQRERLAGLTERGYAALDVMERHLSGHQFFAADAYSVADIALYAYTHVAHEGGFDLARYPAIRAWLDCVAGEPGHSAIPAA